MAPAEWDQIFDIFHAARESSGGERVALLDTACGENTLLRKAVEELLKEDSAASGFLSEPLLSSLKGDRRASRIAPGQRLGRYVMVALIGRGGMGEVWSARDTDLDRTVALKFLSSEALAALDTHQIIHEARAASALNHPGIVTIHEVVQSESTLAIVMELVEGVSIREACGKTLPVPRAVAIGLQIAEALAAAHAGGIVHGDIKPENILLHRDRYVKVLDFGLARKVTTETTGLGVPAFGTLRYMSPEQARGESLTPASDIFSFGLLLYELTAGRHAFPAAVPLETLRAILRQEALPPASVNPSIPARLDSLIRAMLAKQPAVRPSAEEVARKLNELQGSPKIVPDSIPTLLKWVVVAILLVAASFGVWRWTQARDIVETPSFRQITTLMPQNRATAAALSPDGKVAAYASIDGLFLTPLRNGATRVLPTPSSYVVDRLAWFADSTNLVVSGFSANTLIPSIWLVATSGTPARLLRMNARAAAPSPDGKWIAFVTQDWTGIWMIGVDGENARRIVAGPGDDTFRTLFWSPDAKRINFQRRHTEDRSSAGVESAESVLVANAKIVSIAPNIRMNSGFALPDGRVLFLRSEEPTSTTPDQIFEVKTDLSTGSFLEVPRKIGSLSGTNQLRMAGITVSADGKHMMVLRGSHQGAVFTGDFEESPPLISHIQRLTLDDKTSFPHAWTSDSRAVIFESNRNGSFDLFEQHLNEKAPRVIVATPLTEMLAQMAPDGRSLLYAARDDEGGVRDFRLMRVPLEGGVPAEVPIGGSLDEFRCALDLNKRCVLKNTAPGQYFSYYELDPIRGKGAELARTKWTPFWLGNWDISPDGKEIALPNNDSNEARIRVISLEPHTNEPREHEVEVPIPVNVRGLVSAPGGRGWFVSVQRTVGNRMLYVYRDGRFCSLGDLWGWGVPSPNGRHIAFWNHTIATNAWLIERLP